MSHRTTVVVITRNRREELRRTLDRLVGLPGDPPVIVVDNGSSDGTPEAIARAHPRVACVRLGRNLGAAARNIGVSLAATPYVALNDDDSWWVGDSLETAADVLDREPRTAVISGRVVVGDEHLEDPTCAAMAASPLPRNGCAGIPVVGFLAGACVVRRSAFLSVGGFPARYFIGGEEELVAIDLLVAGSRLTYLPKLVTRHQPSPSRDGELRRRLLVRNRLWTAWLRRPAGVAVSLTAEVIRADPGDVAARAFAAALKGLPWVVPARRPVPTHVERMLRTVEAR